MAIKAKTWIVICPQDTPVMEYETLEAATASMNEKTQVDGTRDYLLFECVGGMQRVHQYDTVNVE
jgi:hypothetical protein